jgi:hypothetical protein
VADGEATFELTIYPENGVEQPWDEDSKLPAFMNGLPVDIVGVSIQTIAEPKGAYNGVNQYKPSKITVLGSNPNPSPKAAPAAPAVAAPAQAPKNPTNPNDRDTLIVDQVIFKGAIDLLRGDTTVAKAVENAIAAWEGVRASRHLANRYSVDEILRLEQTEGVTPPDIKFFTGATWYPESEDDFGSL